MNASDFWSRLERRVCREIDGLRVDGFRGLWCDGFIPEQFEVLDDRPMITGRVWIGHGRSEQEEWRFSLLLPQGVCEEAHVDWSAALPGDDVTGWLLLDQAQRTMKLDPAAAYPDRQPGEEKGTSSSA